MTVPGVGPVVALAFVATLDSPARLRTLLAALEGTEPVADPRGFRFKDPATGREIWLASVPDQ